MRGECGWWVEMVICTLVVVRMYFPSRSSHLMECSLRVKTCHVPHVTVEPEVCSLTKDLNFNFIQFQFNVKHYMWLLHWIMQG